MKSDEERPPALTRVTQSGLRWAEDAIYLVVALVLSVGAIALLVQAIVALATGVAEGVEEAVKKTLDLLLLVFILVELLGAVRTTVNERKLVAEPFLIVGMIATIKEVVVAAIDAKDLIGKPEFGDAMIEIGALAGLLVALAIASFLMRLKEREPEE